MTSNSTMSAAPTTAPEAFLFDIGNVLLRFDFARFDAPFIRRCARWSREAATEMADLKHRMEDGQVSAHEFAESAIRLAGFEGDADDLWQLWVDIFWPNEPMFAVVEALAGQGHPLFILSNTNGPHADHIVSTYDVFRHFRRSIYSHEARASKPGEAIFRTAIETCGLRPERTLYIDDLPANVETGRRLGFRSLAYDPDRHNAFLNALAENGVTLPGDPNRPADESS